MNQKRSALLKQEKLLAKKKEKKEKSLLDKPLKLQLFKLLKNCTEDDFIVEHMLVNEEREYFIFHKSKVIELAEDSISFRDSEGEIVYTLSMKKPSYTSWFEELASSLIEAYETKLSHECILSAIKNINAEYARKLHKHIGIKMYEVVKAVENIEEEDSFVEIEADDDFEDIQEEEGGVRISGTAAELIRMRNAKKQSEKSEETSEETPEPPAEEETVEEEEIPHGNPPFIEEEEDDWDVEDRQ